MAELSRSPVIESQSQMKQTGRQQHNNGTCYGKAT